MKLKSPSFRFPRLVAARYPGYLFSLPHWQPCLVYSLLSFFFFCTSAGLHAQRDSSGLAQKLADYQIKGSVGLQLWSTYSMDGRLFDGASGRFTDIGNRLNTQIRRSRYKLTGRPYPTLSFRIVAALDLVGHDVLSATEAGGNNAPSPQFRLWDALINWQLLPQSDALHFSVGYFLVPHSRESLTGAMHSTSFEKPWSQNYIRRHLAGSGPGRAAGLKLAGQLSAATDQFHFSYELAVQNPTFQALAGNSGGRMTSPLLVGRLSLQFGDPESEVYRATRRVNYFGQRQGLSLGFGVARQGVSAIFSSNSSYGADFLLNYQNWQLDGEYYRLLRTDGVASSNSATGFLRIGRNLPWKKGFIWQPVISFWFFEGPTDLEGQLRASRLDSFTGQDRSLEIGTNLYFNPELKLSLFYVIRAGAAGAIGPAEVQNNYYRQPGVELIERGNYLGLAWVLVL